MDSKAAQFLEEMLDPERAGKADKSPQEIFNVALELHKQGDLVNAETLYRMLLPLAPQNPDLLHYLGLLQFQLGKLEEGVYFIQLALKAAPTYSDAHNNLGNIYVQLKRFKEAEAAYRSAIEHSANHGSALHNLAKLLTRSGRGEEAVAYLERAAELNPRLESLRFDLVQTFVQLRQGDRDEDAARILHEHLREEPDSPWARQVLAGLTGENVPDRAPDAYLERVFDHYADHFDESMELLKCSAPALVVSALARLRDQHGDLRMLDAGCGTGLSGIGLKPYAVCLDGVDISPAMLDGARARELYDNLYTGELTEFLQSCETPYDVIASADVFEYFGNVEPLLTAAHSALVAGGALIFTVEYLQQDDEEQGFKLAATGRYLHTRQYIRAALERSGFLVREIEEGVIRENTGEPVAGLVVSAETA